MANGRGSYFRVGVTRQSSKRKPGVAQGSKNKNSMFQAKISASAEALRLKHFQKKPETGSISQ